MNASPVLLVHGGAWAIPDDAVEAHERGVRAAAETGWRVLEKGGSALDAVEEAIVAMEDDETFDAGRGSFLNEDGRVQLDALMMDGATLQAGGVGCVERLMNPIRAARKVLSDSPHIYFVGEGAERFAEEHGIALCANEELIIERELVRWKDAKKQQFLKVPSEFAGPGMDTHDTVGAVALDAQGNIAAGTSTGGTLNKAAGRVGDSSLIGCGGYADNLSAAVSVTGWGEPMMKLVLSKWAADRVEMGDAPQTVATAAIERLYTRLNGHGGIILLDSKGRIGLAHNTPRMAWAWKRPNAQESGVVVAGS
ncbi:peptidase T2, asparaginase 2 [Candidatus Koribacter versatilis Ellin345]|uniref:Isoaspartyl peptidase n=1 Tax=Koribacter versatilis (strain Ellin345) TaxID=204669 RepID=Q1IU95_KORVE|nr:isoaspartyl peptidase/L-asparaginase [Candidatus Koribacter versatilis]ABF39555.1 peptidase T2, asparaginase 2 [Candidatus Koribacter versatilis Ellin345]